jgi:hypothetical protein
MADELPNPGDQPGTTSPGNQQIPPQPNQPQTQQTVPAKKVLANQDKPLGPGTLVVAKYDFWRHDAYPLILISKTYTHKRTGLQMVAGINLHYLTFKFIQYLVKAYCNNPRFDYKLIKGSKFVVKAFRTYKKSGLKTGKAIDGDFLLNVLGTARSYNPNEVEAIRQHIQQQLRQQANLRVDQMTAQNTNQLFNQQKSNQASQPGQPASIPGQSASQPAEGGS